MTYPKKKVSVYFNQYSWANGTYAYNCMAAQNGIFTYACCEKKMFRK